MNKLTAAATVLAAAALLLTSCADPARGTTESGPLQAQYVDLPDGRVVICVTPLADQWPASGITCDWPNATLEGETP